MAHVNCHRIACGLKKLSPLFYKYDFMYYSLRPKKLVMHFLRRITLYFMHTENLSSKCLQLNNICLLAGYIYKYFLCSIFDKTEKKDVHIDLSFTPLPPKKQFPVANWIEHPNRNHKYLVKNFYTNSHSQ
jgi:hypothetical protein